MNVKISFKTIVISDKFLIIKMKIFSVFPDEIDLSLHFKSNFDL